MPPSKPANAPPVRLQDGRLVALDSLGPPDRADLLAGFEGLSASSRYLRFFSPMPNLPDFMTDGLLHTDPSHHVALGGRLLDAAGRPEPPVIAVARYFRTPEHPHVAEPAIAVVDRLQGLGLGRLMMRRLSAVARARGVTHFRAQVLQANTRVIELLQAANARIVEHEGGVLVYEIDIRRSRRQPRRVLSRILAAMLNSQPTVTPEP